MKPESHNAGTGPVDRIVQLRRKRMRQMRTFAAVLVPLAMLTAAVLFSALVDFVASLPAWKLVLWLVVLALLASAAWKVWHLPDWDRDE